MGIDDFELLKVLGKGAAPVLRVTPLSHTPITTAALGTGTTTVPSLRYMYIKPEVSPRHRTEACPQALEEAFGG